MFRRAFTLVELLVVATSSASVSARNQKRKAELVQVSKALELYYQDHDAYPVAASWRGNCIDNAPIESFFGHLKDDVDYKRCKTFDELYSLIADYMQYYNNERQQWDLKKMTPVGYRNHLLAAV